MDSFGLSASAALTPHLHLLRRRGQSPKDCVGLKADVVCLSSLDDEKLKGKEKIINIKSDRPDGNMRMCFSSLDDEGLKGNEKIINIKSERPDGNIRRASRKAATTVLQVDRARLMDVDAISRKSSRLLPRALLEALTDRIQAGQWESALKVFALLRLQEWYDPKEETYVKLLVMLGKCKQPDKALNVFQMIAEDKIVPSLEAMTTLLSAYMNSKRLSAAFDLFASMKRSAAYQPDVYVYSLMIKGCCKGELFDQASLLLGEMQDSGIEPNAVTYNTLIDAFGKVGMLSQMEELFKYSMNSRSCKPDTWTWNTIIKHYGNSGNIKKMEDWFENLQAAGVHPDRITFNTLIYAYGKKGLYDKMRSVVVYMRKYLYGIDLVTYNTVIEAYGRGGMIDEMNSTFLAMKRAGVKFTAYTLCCMLSAYARVGMWEEVDKVRRQWKNSDLIPDAALYNSLIHAYRMAGNVVDMEAAFLEMKQVQLLPDDITYAILMEAYKRPEMKGKAEQLMKEMRSLGRQRQSGDEIQVSEHVTVI